MQKVGTKLTGLVVKAGRTLGSITGFVKRTEELVEEARQRKLTKEYPTPIRLLVAFEDRSVSRDARLEERLRAVIRGTITGVPCPFRHIYLVGASKRILIDYRVR
jgi:hypothetical protein